MSAYNHSLPSQPPPMRLFLLGPRGAGKTTAGRQLAERLGVFHVGFRDLLQESILPKMKKPPLTDEDEWEGPEVEEEEEKGGTLVSIVCVNVCMCTQCS